MKAKNKVMLRICALVIAIMMVAVAIPTINNNVTYASEENSNDFLDTKEYILKNLNPDLVTPTKMEEADILFVTHILTDKDKLPTVPEGQTMLDVLYETDESVEAFIANQDSYMIMYNVDDNSDYYVAYIDTMRHNESAEVIQTSFAYTNINGQVIDTAIYDKDTGIAYIEKTMKIKMVREC